MLVATVVGVEESKRIQNFETVHNSNAAILSRLGLVPLRIPEGHHKKRLSGPEPSGLLSVDSHTRIHQPYSRRHGHRDSHVYIVKLPASQPYYTLTKPHKPTGNEDDDKITKTTTTKLSSSSDGGSSPQVGFNSNGKPGKIYHWNLPIMKKMTEKKRLHSQMRFEQIRKKLEEEMKEQTYKRLQTEEAILANTTKTSTIPVTTPRKPIGPEFNAKRYHHSTSGNDLHHDDKPIKHVRNNNKRLNYPRTPEELRKIERPENLEKQSRNTNDTVSNKKYRFDDSNLYMLGVGNAGLHSKDRLAGWHHANELHASRNALSGQKPKKHRKKAAMSYYAPIKSAKIVGTTSIQKNFPGNGKPKGFYVMEKSRQPIYYHNLLP